MRIHRDQLGMRVAGSLLGMGFIAAGLFAIFGAPDGLDPALRAHARGFGITALIAGGIAVPVSWLVQRLDNIWCAPPRSGWFRAKRHDADARPESMRDRE
jgi:hypothetical protein